MSEGRHCTGCGADISLKDPSAKFCGDPCKNRHKARRRRAGNPTPAKLAAAPDGAVPDIAVTQARKALVELALKQAELDAVLEKTVPADAVEARFARFSTGLRTRMLGAPSHARQYLPPRFSREDIADAMAAFERAQREKLAEAADAIDAGEV